MQKQHRIIILSIILLLLECSVGSIGFTEDAKPGKATTVILIRHAERDNFFTLTHKGHERSKVLIDAVGGLDITAIYSPDLARDLDTAGGCITGEMLSHNGKQLPNPKSCFTSMFPKQSMLP